MKYKVAHSILSSPNKTFKRDEIVTPAELTDAGFDVEFLKRNNAIDSLEGTEAAGDPHDEEEPKFAGKPLSYFADKSDEEILSDPDVKVGDKTLAKIRAAQK